MHYAGSAVGHSHSTSKVHCKELCISCSKVLHSAPKDINTGRFKLSDKKNKSLIPWAISHHNILDNLYTCTVKHQNPTEKLYGIFSIV